jgi:uncharacterized protein (TIGR03435 family)
MMQRALVIFFFQLFLLPFAYSQLVVGDKAPDIQVEKWVLPRIKVEDKAFEELPQNFSGQTIVLDFWFTKCAPCVASIPELNRLSARFPDILFLSVSYETDSIIEDFLEKMIIYYPVGSDPSLKTIHAYNVFAYPVTFVIDTAGIIRWKGSPFRLTEDILEAMAGRPASTKDMKITTSELPFQNSAYEFTMKEHHLNMEESSYYHFNPYDINILNKDLEDMLRVFYGINSSRIICEDTSLLEKKWDITLKADPELTTRANCVEMMKYLLPQNLEVQLNEVEMDTMVYVISIENDSLLHAHLSDSRYFLTSVVDQNWKAKGATLQQMADFIESSFHVVAAVEPDDSRIFDFTIPSGDFEKAVRSLSSDYGLQVQQSPGKAGFWEVRTVD